MPAPNQLRCIPYTEPSRVCSRCKKDKPREAYLKVVRSGIEVYHYRCIQCGIEANKLSRSQYRARRPLDAWIRSALNITQTRAKRLGFTCSLTRADLKVIFGNGHCTYCGIKLCLQNDKIQRRLSSPSLDQLVPRAGYTIENVVISCFRCNSIKSDATPTELRQIANEYERLLKERNLQTGFKEADPPPADDLPR